MATVSLSLSIPRQPSAMTSRRAPLANNPNAANSPIRTGHSLSKPTKIYSRLMVADRDRDSNLQPPAKKQALNDGRQRHVTYRDNSLQDHRSRGSTYEMKLARERSRLDKASAITGRQLTTEDLDNLRHWKSHHKAKFPRFVFYFEKVPEKDRYKCAKQLCQLGAVSIIPFFCLHAHWRTNINTIIPNSERTIFSRVRLLMSLPLVKYLQPKQRRRLLQQGPNKWNHKLLSIRLC